MLAKLPLQRLPLLYVYRVCRICADEAYPVPLTYRLGASEFWWSIVRNDCASCRSILGGLEIERAIFASILAILLAFIADRLGSLKAFHTSQSSETGISIAMRRLS